MWSNANLTFAQIFLPKVDNCTNALSKTPDILWHVFNLGSPIPPNIATIFTPQNNR